MNVFNGADLSSQIKSSQVKIQVKLSLITSVFVIR